MKNFRLTPLTTCWKTTGTLRKICTKDFTKLCGIFYLLDNKMPSLTNPNVKIITIFFKRNKGPDSQLLRDGNVDSLSWNINGERILKRFFKDDCKQQADKVWFSFNVMRHRILVITKELVRFTIKNKLKLVPLNDSTLNGTCLFRLCYEC